MAKMNASQIVNAFVSKRELVFKSAFDGRNQRQVECTDLIWLSEKQTSWLFSQGMAESSQRERGRIEGTAVVDGIGLVEWTLVLMSHRSRNGSLQLVKAS